MVRRGRLRVSADTAVHLGSVSFWRSPSDLGKRQHGLDLFPGSSDHPHPGLSKGAADIRTHPASTALLLLLLSQAELQLFSGKWLYFNKAGTRSSNPWCPSDA